MAKEKACAANCILGRHPSDAFSCSCPLGDIRPADCGNHALEHYYKGQGIVGDDEWETLLQCMKSSLPLAVRISLNRPERKSRVNFNRGSDY